MLRSKSVISTVIKDVITVEQVNNSCFTVRLFSCILFIKNNKEKNFSNKYIFYRT